MAVEDVLAKVIDLVPMPESAREALLAELGLTTPAADAAAVVTEPPPAEPAPEQVPPLSPPSGTAADPTPEPAAEEATEEATETPAEPPAPVAESAPPA